MTCQDEPYNSCLRGKTVASTNILLFMFIYIKIRSTEKAIIYELMSNTISIHFRQSIHDIS